ncbi:MAG TPA: serine/threonine-protein kinase [Polyangia bacterium]|nr:serine/threonine-protein kinase [Polyangia bacterium]
MSDATPAATPVTLADEGADLPSAAPPAAGNDRYVLEREIGSGGMGRVFAARDLRLSRPVAIKMLRVRDAALAARFEREVRLAARLQHPGVVPVYDAGFWPSGEPFLVMKLVLGQSLARVIRDADTPADRLALLPHVITAAEAVAYAHDQGIVHRDLKPINIVVGAFGETIVLDWGLAKDLRAAGDEPDVAALATPPGDTAAGAVLGTPSYMAPEQAAGRAVDARADVYALGAILHHALAGAPPEAHSGAPSPAGPALVPLAALEPRLPPDLLAVVAKALATDPQARYATAFELAEDLKRFQAGQLVGARRYSTLARAARFAARHPLAAVASAAAALAVLAALAAR